MSADRIIVCTSPSAADAGPYFIGYSDMVDGYRHAYAETNGVGRVTIRRSRSANHPVDPRCPECAADRTEDAR